MTIEGNDGEARAEHLPVPLPPTPPPSTHAPPHLAAAVAVAAAAAAAGVQVRGITYTYDADKPAGQRLLYAKLLLPNGIEVGGCGVQAVMTCKATKH